MPGVDALADRVRRERLRREWSVRDAAAAGGISNTYWGQFEDYRQPLTPLIAAAVARAYGWNDDWADEVAAADVSQYDELVVRIRRLEQAMLRVQREVGEMPDADELLDAIRAAVDADQAAQ